jgi:hypothetical protein
LKQGSIETPLYPNGASFGAGIFASLAHSQQALNLAFFLHDRSGASRTLLVLSEETRL